MSRSGYGKRPAWGPRASVAAPASPASGPSLSVRLPPPPLASCRCPAAAFRRACSRLSLAVAARVSLQNTGSSSLFASRRRACFALVFPAFFCFFLLRPSPFFAIMATSVLVVRSSFFRGSAVAAFALFVWLLPVCFFFLLIRLHSFLARRARVRRFRLAVRASLLGPSAGFCPLAGCRFFSPPRPPRLRGRFWFWAACFARRPRSLFAVLFPRPRFSEFERFGR